TVEIARHSGLGPQAGFVNALLRGYTREREATRNLLADLKVADPALGYSHPKWLWERWTARWGNELSRGLLEWNNTEPKVFARLNTIRSDANALLARWQSEGVSAEARSWDWTGEDLVWELESSPSL